jgi:hypothetical protein
MAWPAARAARRGGGSRATGAREVVTPAGTAPAARGMPRPRAGPAPDADNRLPMNIRVGSACVCASSRARVPRPTCRRGAQPGRAADPHAAPAPASAPRPAGRGRTPPSLPAPATVSGPGVASLAPGTRRVRCLAARLGGARLGGARLGGARLGGARLGGARLGGARLGGARLGGAGRAPPICRADLPGSPPGARAAGRRRPPPGGAGRRSTRKGG